MKDITERLKHLLRFHEGKVNQFRDDKEAQEFHKGAVMAFSKCQVLLDYYHPNPPLEPTTTTVPPQDTE